MSKGVQASRQDKVSWSEINSVCTASSPRRRTWEVLHVLIKNVSHCAWCIGGLVVEIRQLKYCLKNKTEKQKHDKKQIRKSKAKLTYRLIIIPRD